MCTSIACYRLSRRHEKALEHLKAEIAAKEAEESAPRSFRARPILK
jgi:hypothetical protein